MRGNDNDVVNAGLKSHIIPLNIVRDSVRCPRLSAIILVWITAGYTKKSKINESLVTKTIIFSVF